VPPIVETLTSTVPANPDGLVAVTEVGELTVNVEAAEEPNFTPVVPTRLVPVMVTLVPPDVGPWFGLTDVTVGAATKVYWSAELVADVPPTVVTVTLTVPAAETGLVTVIEVDELTMNVVATDEPNETVVAPVKFVPVIVTELAEVGPEVGPTAVTVGAAT
jgi:hypothetical protein